MSGGSSRKNVISLLLLISSVSVLAAGRGGGLLSPPTLENAQEWLIQAAEDDDTVLLEEVLRLGVDVNSAKPHRYNALQVAAAKGNMAVITLLLKHPGIDVNAQTEDVYEPDTSFSRFPRECYRHESPLKLALGNGHNDAAILLLAHPDIDLLVKSQQFIVDANSRKEYDIFERFQDGDEIPWSYVKSESILCVSKKWYGTRANEALLRKIAEPRNRDFVDHEAWSCFLRALLSERDFAAIDLALDTMAEVPAFYKAWIGDDKTPGALASALFTYDETKRSLYASDKRSWSKLVVRLAQLYPNAEIYTRFPSNKSSFIAKAAKMADRFLVRKLLRAGADAALLPETPEWRDIVEQENYIRRSTVRARVDQDTLANDVFSVVAGYMK